MVTVCALPSIMVKHVKSWLIMAEHASAKVDVLNMSVIACTRAQASFVGKSTLEVFMLIKDQIAMTIICNIICLYSHE